ncbi:GTPase [Scytonema sp. UIC 10036]|uniref:GTPase n=1 Tax=Scytonema sp. UIC 10036 TaxID=2304196 RepID=UPI00140F776B|nr:GTPase [Scytonema sp. UIC 10036]
MKNNNKTIQIAAIGKKFDDSLENFENLLAQETTNEIETIRRRLNEELEEHRKRGFLTVAFIGQYSAGKSTIISALTGRNDIYIDSDIATDKTTHYDWNGIKLIDTPGLWTGHEDHDEITYDAMEKADLLVFCLTHSLFDSLILDNFKKLAYKNAYAHKMMLVINKMSQEAGEEQQKIASYRDSLEKSLEPHKLEEFPICFIDAKDYYEGIEDNDDYLIEASRFQTFIDELNNFVKNRAGLARLDTPIRITSKWVDEAKLKFARSSPEDKAFFEILTRLSCIVEQNRQRLRTNIKCVVSKTAKDIVKEGNTLANTLDIGNETEFKQQEELTINNLKLIDKQAQESIVDIFKKAAIKLQNDIQELHQNSLLQELVSLDDKKVSQQINSKIIQTKISFGTKLNDLINSSQKLTPLFASSSIAFIALGQSAINKETWDKMHNAHQVLKALKNASLNVLQAQEPSVHAEALNAFHDAQQHYYDSVPIILHPENVEGSLLHQTVEQIGHWGDSLGIHFDLVDSVGLTTFLGNLGHILGPILGSMAVYSELEKMNKESEQERKVSNEREKIRQKFREAAKKFELEIENKRQGFEANVYDEIENQIQTVRTQGEEEIATSNAWMKKLIEIRSDFDELVCKIMNMINPELGNFLT